MNTITLDKNKINKKLYALVKNTYFEYIPLDEIKKIFFGNGYYSLVNEDRTEFEAIFCGDNGSTNILISGMNNKWFILQWYKMASGRYEINCYIS